VYRLIPVAFTAR